MACTGSAASRTFQAGAKYANAEFIQVHPTAIPGADKLRLMSESARGEGGRVWVPRRPHDPRPPREIPEADRYYFLEERYPKYGNLVPRDIATREIFNVCTAEGLSVEKDRLAVYLDLTHIPRAILDHKLGGILEIYEKFQGVDPREVPMKIFPAVHYSMGGLWVDYEANSAGGLVHRLGPQPANQHSRPVRHRRVRLPVSRRQSAGGQLAAELHFQRTDRRTQHSNRDQGRKSAAAAGRALRNAPGKHHQAIHDRLLRRPGGGENPYLLHQELGQVMTKVATVVRHNEQLADAYRQVSELADRAGALLALRHRPLDQSKRGVHQVLQRHVPAGQGDSQRGAGPRRMPRRPLQARLRHAGRRACRSGRTAALGRGLVRPVRGEHPPLAQIDHRGPVDPTASRN